MRTLHHRLARLEAAIPQQSGRGIADLTDAELERLIVLDAKAFKVGLTAEEQAERDRFALEEAPSVLDDWEIDDAELQAKIDETACDLIPLRQFAETKTWMHSHHSALVCTRWRLTVEASNHPEREKVADLLRLRSRGIGLAPEKTAWLAAVLVGFDLGEEGPWLRDYLGAGEGAKSLF